MRPYCRFGHAVTDSRWNDEAAGWEVTTDDGEVFRAPFVISGIGMFNELVWPDIDGLDTFKGTLFHSARWDKSVDLTGKRVAVIGSAASAVQFVPQNREADRSITFVPAHSELGYPERRFALYAGSNSSTCAMSRMPFMNPAHRFTKT